ncbi:MAG: hypothetical protein M3Q24_01065 [bacterium]|nr:hypothetical protein [bacterium]
MADSKKLSQTTSGLMIAVAVFFDAFQLIINLIPVLGQIISVVIGFFAFLTFYFWFSSKGVKFATPKRGGILGGGFIVEMIPIINMLPAWTLAVVLIILDQKKKELLNKVTGSPDSPRVDTKK